MKLLNHKTLLAAFLAAAFSTAALAGGMFEQYPTATAPLTGAETIPADTNLSGGRNPQTEKITVDTLKNAMLANSGTASATPNGTATATAGAATVTSGRFRITSEALTTAAGADYTLTVTNTYVLATSVVVCSVDNGTNTTAGMAVGRVTPGAGSLVVLARNTHASSAWNGTIRISCVVYN